LTAQTEELKAAKADTLTSVTNFKQALAQSEKEKASMATEIEAKAADLEILQLEIEALKDEKEDLINQMKLAAEMNESQDDALAGLSEDELKSQNQKLR